MSKQKSTRTNERKCYDLITLKLFAFNFSLLLCLTHYLYHITYNKFPFNFSLFYSPHSFEGTFQQIIAVNKCLNRSYVLVVKIELQFIKSLRAAAAAATTFIDSK